MNKVYTTKEVAEILQVSVNTVKIWLKEGRLKGTKVGKSWRINDEDLRQIAPIAPKKEEPEQEQDIYIVSGTSAERRLMEFISELQERYHIEDRDIAQLNLHLKEVSVVHAFMYQLHYQGLPSAQKK